MIRFTAASTLALMLTAIPAAAQEMVPEQARPVVMAPSAAVADAWAKEGQKLTLARPAKATSPALRNLFISYGAVQGLDVISTAVARNRGASETNPLLRGGLGQGLAIKAGLGVVTVLAARAVHKKSKKAAIITMIALNAATAAVVVNNIKVANHRK